MGDAEREDRSNMLSEHFALGRLTKSDFDARLDTVLTAQSLAQADVALADLPRMASAVAAVSPAPPFQSPERWEPWGPWMLTGVICLVVWVATSLAQGTPLYFWPGWVIGPWGLVLLARHWTRTPPRIAPRELGHRP